MVEEFDSKKTNESLEVAAKLNKWRQTMTKEPRRINLEQIADVIADRFKDREAITCYIGSNAATPTSSIEALTDAVQLKSPRLPFLRMVHLLTQGNVPYVAEGLQASVMTYSIFSSKEGTRESGRLPTKNMITLRRWTSERMV